jgi:ribonuclease HI
MFYNADLVEEDINDNSGALAFIDDYLWWTVGDTDEENVKRMETQNLPRAMRWAAQNSASFEVNKFAVMHFASPYRKSVNTSAPVHIGNYLLQPQSSMKWLGVELDAGLRWKEQVASRTKSATQCALQVQRFADLRPAQKRQLVVASVLPRIDYAAAAWFHPGKDKASGWKCSSLNGPLRIAARGIIGAFSTVSLDAVSVETNLMPTNLRLELRIYNSIAAIATLPTSHPIRQTFDKAGGASRKSLPWEGVLGWANTHWFSQGRPIEEIKPMPVPPWWQCPLETEIAPNREAAATSVRLAEATTINIFSDGSGMNGKIGAAATQLQGGSRQATLGTDAEFTVFSGELVGLSLAVDLLHEPGVLLPLVKTKATIWTDNQASIRSINLPQRQSAQSMILKVLKKAEKLRQDYPQLDLRLAWTPGHYGVAGNEEADTLAKMALDGTIDPTRPRLLAAMKADFRQQITKRWTTQWRQSTHGRFTRWIDESLPGKHTREIYGRLTRARSALLAQLRTGHSFLQDYQLRVRRQGDGGCACGEAKETVGHVLLTCKLYTSLRRTLRSKIGGQASGSIKRMLGAPSWRFIGRNGKMQKVRNGPDLETVVAVLGFAEQTGRFTMLRNQSGEGGDNGDEGEEDGNE